MLSTGFVLILVVALAVAAEAQALAKRIRDGDHDAFRTFFDRHHARLFGFLRSRGLPDADAEDLVQTAFIYIWRHRERIDPDQSLRAYLFRIGHTRALNRHRDAARFDPDTAVDGTPSAAASPEADALSNEQRDRIERAIEALSPRRQQVVRLCLLHDFTYKEAADVLDIARKTVENHVGLALKDLRAALREE